MFITGKEAKHLVRVLRYKEGDRLMVSDGQKRYRVQIEKMDREAVTVLVLETIQPTKLSPAPALGVALLKHDRLEWMIQKAVELGVSEFYLLITERTIPQYQEATSVKKMARFQKIAEEAAKQSGMIQHPKIYPVIKWGDLLNTTPSPLPSPTRGEGSHRSILIGWEQSPPHTFQKTWKELDPSHLLILIGPEGGLSENEVAQALAKGAKTFGLGDQILRSETAALAVVTLCQNALGNM